MEIEQEDAAKVGLIEFGEIVDEESANPLLAVFRICAQYTLMSIGVYDSSALCTAAELTATLCVPGRASFSP